MSNVNGGEVVVVVDRMMRTLLVFLGLYSDEPLIVKVVMVKVKLFHYRPGQTLRVLGC